MRLSIITAAALVAGVSGSALAQDAYVVGITAALTGPPARGIVRAGPYPQSGESLEGLRGRNVAPTRRT